MQIEIDKIAILKACYYILFKILEKSQIPTKISVILSLFYTNKLRGINSTI